MSLAIDARTMAGMIAAAARKIRANEAHLSALDSAIGDGDHGTTICRVMDAAETAARAHAGASLRELLDKVGWDVMSVDGGSTSPLMGSFFVGLSESAPDSLDTPAAAAMFASGLANLRQQTRAQVGDKTMLDAIIPAVEALQAAAASGTPLPAALRQAAQAARAGAEATRQMKAKFGRARNLGDRVLGHPDPGATSLALIFEAFADQFASAS